MRVFILIFCTFLIGCATAPHRANFADVQQNPLFLMGVKDARETLPSFLRNLQNSNGSFMPGAAFRVVFKSPNNIPNMADMLWVTPISTITNNKFSGMVAEVPLPNFGLNIGETVTFSGSAIVDWSWTQRDGTVFGGFTSRAEIELGAAPHSSNLLHPERIPADWK